MVSPTIRIRLAPGVASLSPKDWDACAGTANPFLSHAFLSALERSGSATADSGWQSLPVVIEAEDGAIAAVAPLYVKSHSQGEYVFDHGWSDAWERAGGRYYPKLLSAVPFTPVPGSRLLVRESQDPARDDAMAAALVAAMEAVADDNGLSSAHVTFVEEAQLRTFTDAGWLVREGVQFHWHNRGYRGFDDFLADLASRKSLE